MANKSMAVQEKEWQAQDDAHALARAEEIKKDPSRLKNAATAAQKMQQESQKHADNMKKVAQKSPVTKSVQKRVEVQTKTSGKKK